MPNYRRALAPSGCWFFTVNLLANHQIMLWPYYGHYDGSDASTEQLFQDMQASNIARFGLSGCKFSCYALLEGEPIQHLRRRAVATGRGS
jgi:hypothetical protein